MTQHTENHIQVPVAVIGMGALFPKAAGLNEYWRLIFRGTDAITEVPASHWSAQDYYDLDPKRPDHVYCTRGGFLSPFSFDPTEFGIPPASLEATDTSQLLGLVVARMTLDNAGYGNGRDFDKDRASVILGVTGTQELVLPLGARLGFPKWRRALEAAGVESETVQDALERMGDAYVGWQENSFPGLLGNVVAGRISNRLDFGGTNCVVDAACASSMSALHMALMELTSGKSNMVLTGGVDALNDIFMHMCFSKTHILSPTGDVRPFSEAADGTVLGEGIGMVLLKRLADAQKDGDRIHAVIRGIGAASDGRSQSIYAPRAEGQAKALRSAYRSAGINPATVGLVEAHGTGTRVGDKVEFQALCSVYGDRDEASPRCAIGSVKSMIGHTKAAAGSAGLIKTILSLRNKTLPPTLKVDTPDPDLNVEKSPFHINTTTRPWFNRGNHPRRAGVSAFGFGGSNFHVVLEEYGSDKTDISWDASIDILALSGDTPQACVERLADIRKSLKNAMSVSAELRTIARNLRSDFSPSAPFRLLAIIRYDETSPDVPLEAIKQAESAISEWMQTAQPDSLYQKKDVFISARSTPGKLAMLFPGQGSQYLYMGRDVVCAFPESFDAVSFADDKCPNDLPPGTAIYPEPGLTTEARKHQEKRLRDTHQAQPAIGAVSLAMLRVCGRFGIVPDVTCGHSFGELTALMAAGWINEAAFMELAFLRGRLMAEAGEQNGQGGMLAVKAPLEALSQVAAKLEPDVVLANRNTPNQGVLSGSLEGIDIAEKECRKKGFQCVRLPVSAAFHSPLVADAQHPFRKAVAQTDVAPTPTAVFSNTTGTPYPDAAARVQDLLGRQLARPVNFVGAIEHMAATGVNTFLEVGPKSVLIGLVRSTLEKDGVVAISMDASSGRGNGLLDLARAICGIAACGHHVDLTRWGGEAVESRKPKMNIPLTGANYRSKQIRKSPSLKTTTVLKVSPTATQRALQSIGPKEARPDVTTPAPQTKPSQTPRKTMEKKIVASQGAVVDAFRTVQEGMKAIQDLQRETAEAHKKFLETQRETTRTLQMLIQSNGNLAGNDLPMETIRVDHTAPVLPVEIRPEVSTPPADPAQQELETAPSSMSTPAPIPVPETALEKADPAGSIESSPLTDTLLEIVAELTGYPSEMLGLEMDIEADLGIDSIKRVEILSAVDERMPGLPRVTPEMMGTLKTLEQIVDFLTAGDSVESKAAETPSQVESSSNELSETLLEIVADLTGYPNKMLGLEMDIEADLGIDSIKRVEILSAVDERMPGLPRVTPEMMGTLKTLGQIVDFLTADNVAETTVPEPPSAPEAPADQLTDTLLEIVSELTGYPKEMLGLEMDIEADLGIDSIKRVEILSAVDGRMPGLPRVTPEMMGTLKTLGQIVGYLYSTDTPQVAETSPVNEANSSLTSGPASLIRRQELVVKDLELLDSSLHPLQIDGPVYITGDGTGLADALCREITERGVDARLLSETDTETSLEHAAGLIFLGDQRDPIGKNGLRRALMVARAAGSGLQKAAATASSLFATVSRMDGRFGASGDESLDAFQGGLAGLAKTAAREWPGVRCRSLDVDREWDDNDAIARVIANEMLRSDTDTTSEVGFSPGRRSIVALEERPYPSETGLKTDLNPGDVVIVTGGGRGITADAVIPLAEALRPTLVLFGRSPAPTDEPAWMDGLSTEREIKSAILANEYAGKTPKPAELEATYRRYASNRELSRNMERLTAAGAQVRYFPVDIRDRVLVEAALSEIRSFHGPVRGLIHGAGVLEDRLITDKTPEQFERVFTTKVDGLLTLLSVLEKDPIRHLVLFSSVTARFGNRGQSDYAMANEVLNKIARQEAAKRPDTRVVAINWGPWDGGMVSDVLKKEFARRGIDMIPRDEGGRCLLAELVNSSDTSPEIVVGAEISNADPTEETSSVHDMKPGLVN